MASLDLPLLTFSGDFQADVSTVNNDVRHYDNATFENRFQQPRQGSVLNGWWNPTGGSNFSLIGCRVRSAIFATAPAAPDPVLDCAVTGPEGRSTGKLIDLDPQWQGSSEIFGMRIRLVHSSGEVWMDARLRTTPFRDLGVRQIGPAPNGQARGAAWTSVLDRITWGAGASSSPLLAALRASGTELFIRLTGFGYHYTHIDGRFSMGRLLGVIGARDAADPRTCLARRRIAPSPLPGLGPIEFGFDAAHGVAVFDFGNAIPLADALGTAADIGPLQLAILGSDSFQAGHVVSAPESITPAGDIPYRSPDWLLSTSGIHVQAFTRRQLPAFFGSPLALVRPLGDNQFAIRVRENSRGLVARAEDIVLRMDGEDYARVRFFVRQFEQPLAQAEIRCSLAQPDNQSGGGGSSASPPQAPIPWTGLPREGVSFPPAVTTDESGSAELIIGSRNVSNPRGYLDGQIYAIACTLTVAGQAQTDDDAGQINIHLREAIEIPAQPEWHRDIQPVLRQFANLYPVMSRNIVDLGDYDDVVRHKRILLFAFTRDFDDPAYMPASRDLSLSRLAMIVQWLRGDPPFRAEAQPELALAAVRAAPTSPRTPSPAEITGPPRRGAFHEFRPESEE